MTTGHVSGANLYVTMIIHLIHQGFIYLFKNIFTQKAYSVWP